MLVQSQREIEALKHYSDVLFREEAGFMQHPPGRESGARELCKQEDMENMPEHELSVTPSLFLLRRSGPRMIGLKRPVEWRASDRGITPSFLWTTQVFVRQESGYLDIKSILIA